MLRGLGEDANAKLKQERARMHEQAIDAATLCAGSLVSLTTTDSQRRAVCSAQWPGGPEISELNYHSSSFVGSDSGSFSI
eukprot:10300970-Alexandrium_andersonii.AAC.1